MQLPFRAEAFCRYMAEEKKFLLLPGHVYGEAYERYIRIGYGCSTERFEEGLTTMINELQNWR